MTLDKYASFSDILTFAIPFLLIILLPGPTYVAGFLFCYILFLFFLYRSLSLALFQVFLFSFLVGKELFTLERLIVQDYAYFQTPLLLPIPIKVPLRFIIFVFFAISLIKLRGVKAKVERKNLLLINLVFLMITLTVLGQFFGGYSIRFKFPFLQTTQILLVFPFVMHFFLLNSGNRAILKRIKRVFVGFSLFALCLEGIVAFTQFLMKSPIGLNIEGNFNALFVQAPESGLFRSPGTLSHPNYLGVFIGMLLPVPIYLLINTKTKGAMNKLIRLSVFLGLTALFLSFSRWAWICLVLGLGVMVLVERKLLLKILKKEYRLGLQTLVGVMFVVFLFGAAFWRFTRVTTLEGRVNVAKAAISQISSSVLWGVGAGNSVISLAPYRENLESYINSLKGVHNTFLLIGVENGLPVMIFFIIFLVVLIKGAIGNIGKLKKKISFAFFISGIVFILNSMFYPLFFWDPSLELFFTMIAFLVYRLGYKEI